ncbi:MAG: type ISP restriction/modification enzyme, partial [Anaerolineae bacterium]
ADAFRHRLGHVIRTSDALAERLAELARRTRGAANTLMAHESERGPLRQLHRAFQTALIHDLTEEQFADTYAQTVTYGLLTAAIQRTDLQGGRHDTTLYSDMLAEVVPITNPFLKEMLQTFLHIGGQQGGINFDELGIQDVVDLLRGDETDLPAILRDFGNRTRGEDPVIHFYEHFLAAYDKKLKVQRGIFYTPQPVVSYIVRSVHELLQTEFGLADGLASTVTWGEMAARGQGTEGGFRIPEGTDPASPFVTILDPATGTATFLVEVIEVIYRHLRAKWDSPERKQLPGLSTFILQPSSFADYWNDYVPRHLLPRLHGYELMMAPYAIAHMKIGLKLHETGYRFGSVERVRVYLTNALEPPDDERGQLAFAGWTPALAHEAQAVNAIKRWQRFTVVIGNPPYSNFGQLNRIPWILELLDAYKRGLAERKINLDDDFIKFIRFAQYLLDASGMGILGFITNNTYLDGVTHRQMRESLLRAFSWVGIVDLHGSVMKADTCPDGSPDENVFDIKQGVSVGLFCRTVGGAQNSLLHYDMWGTRSAKYSVLSTAAPRSMVWQALPATKPTFFFVPKSLRLAEEYEDWPSIATVFREFVSGIQTGRDSFVSSESEADFEARLSVLMDPSVSNEEVGRRYKLPDFDGFDLGTCRRTLRDTHTGKACRQKWLYRPFDVRPILFHDSVIKRTRGTVMKSLLVPNVALITVRQLAKIGFSHVFVTKHMGDGNAISINTREYNYYFPLHVYPSNLQISLPVDSTLNMAEEFIRQVRTKLGAKSVDSDKGDSDSSVGAIDIFRFAYAVLHSPTYRARYAEFLKIDFPRVPLTSSLELFRSLAALGGELVGLHLLESPALARRITTYAGPAAPTVEKVAYAGGAVWLDKAQTAGFRGVPEPVWNFHIGGYQVCEKWRKDRKGRTLSAEEIEHYQRVVVALNETIRVMGEIDEVIEAHGGWPIR